MSDADGDSTMLSDHSSIDDAAFNDDDLFKNPRNPAPTFSNQAAPRTPARFTSALAAELSPPDSQGSLYPNPASSALHDADNLDGRPDSPPGGSSSVGLVGLNANGKRVHSSAMGAGSEGNVVAAGSGDNASNAANGEGRPMGRATSGYEWQKAEDEPGYGWKNKKAVEEFHRALEQIVDKGLMVKTRYGDPCLPMK